MLKITRLEYGENETIGVLQLFGKVLCYTLELPWKDNKQNISCIPTGKYKCIVAKYKGKDRWLIQNVPNRDGIFIHEGNVHSEIKGCVLIGSGIGYLNDDRAVLGSANAMHEFMLKTKGMNEIELEVC
jgi:hypothetical protein